MGARHSRRILEPAMHVREAQLREALALAHCGTWEWDVPANAVAWSDELRAILGVNADYPATPENFLKFIHPEDRAWAERTMRESLRTGIARETPFRIVRRDGSVRVVHGRSVSIAWEKGNPVLIAGVIQDLGGCRANLGLERDALEKLSKRERAVLERVVRGAASREIADELGLSAKTVDTYRSRVMAKLQIHDLAGLVRFAVRHALVDA